MRRLVPAAQAWLVRVVDNTKDEGEVATTEVEHVEVAVPPSVGAGFTVNCHARLPAPPADACPTVQPQGRGCCGGGAAGLRGP